MTITGRTVMGVEWGVIIPISMSFVLARLYVRTCYTNNFSRWSDGFLLVSHALQLMNSCFDTYLYTKGFFGGGDVTSVLSPSSTIIALKIAYVSPVIYYVALWTIKAALISIYMHLIPINNNLHRRAMLALKIYAGITFVIVMVVNTLWCQPVSRNWSLDPSLNCWSYAILEVNIISAVCHLTTDIAIFLMPFPLLRHLTIPKPQKIAIAFTFGVGSISIIATILRLIFVWTTASIEQVAIWSCVEIAAGVIVICFPGLRVLLQTYLQEKGWSQGSSGRSGSKRQRQSWMVGGRQSGSWIERERDRRRRSSGLMPELEVDELTVDQHGRVIRKCEAVAMEEGLRHDRDVHIEEDGSETYIIQKNDAPLQSAISPPQMGTTTKITAEPVYGRSI